MQRITTQMIAHRSLVDLTQSYDRLSTTQEQLSSGKRINLPSDDPYGAGHAVELSGELAGLSTYSRNVDDGTAWTQATDGALMNMQNITQRARELLVEAGNDTTGQAGRNDTAAEIDQLTDALKQEANTQYAGQYVFAGTATTTAPYTIGGADTYNGNTGTISRQIGPGSSIQVNSDISSVLGSGQSAADGKLLATLRDISQHLRGGTTADANALRTTDLANLDSNLDALSTLQANVGATENRLALAASRISDLQISTTKLLSDTQDVDFAKAATDYSTEQASYTAALRASANIIQSSLLDFLK
jgi:flagellar hook-associated protein 3 FlgL